MGLGKLFVVGCLAYSAYQFWPAGSAVSASASGGASHAAFASVPKPSGHDDNTVYIVAALNCTKDAAKRADTLVEALKARGISVARTNNVNWSGNIGPTDVPRIQAVMNGEAPVVFYGGRGAANPSLDQVLTELGRT